MTHKVHPRAFRLGHTVNWKSVWFNQKKYKEYLEQDYKLREFLMQRLKEAAVEEVKIKRSVNSINIIIHTARPGIIIGRGGAGITELKKEVIDKIFKKQIKGLNIKIDIEEIKRDEIYARITAQNIAEQLERRMYFRRVIKKAMEKLVQSPKIKGAKISISGRLGGTEMARTEWLKKGEMPLNTIRADIDYALVSAHTKYGAIGVKVWLYKGEKFD